MSYLKNIKNRIYVGIGNYPTLKEATDWFNNNATNDTEILLDAGSFPVADTVIINNPNYFCRIEGLGQTITIIDATTGLASKPMFNVKTACDFNKISCDGTTLANYGTLANENCFQFDSTAGLYSEMTDLTINSFKIGIEDRTGVDLFLYNFIVSACDVGFQSDYTNTGTSATVKDIEIGNFEHCNTGISLTRSAKENFLLSSLVFKHKDSSGIAVAYNGTTYKYGEIANIFNSTYNDKGTFLSGFDFTLARDADIEIRGNIGVEDKNPHAKINVLDNASTTTAVIANTYYKAVFNNGNIYTTKMGLAAGKMTYLSKNKRDAMMWVSGGIFTGTNRTLTVSLRKNIFVTSVTGNGALVTVTTTIPHNLTTGVLVQMLTWTGGSGTWNGLYTLTSTGTNTFTYAATGNGTATGGTAGAMISPMSVRANANQPTSFAIAAYIDGIIQNDYIEIYLSSTNSGDSVTLSDLTWLMDSK